MCEESNSYRTCGLDSIVADFIINDETAREQLEVNATHLELSRCEAHEEGSRESLQAIERHKRRGIERRARPPLSGIVVPLSSPEHSSGTECSITQTGDSLLNGNWSHHSTDGLLKDGIRREAQLQAMLRCIPREDPSSSVEPQHSYGTATTEPPPNFFKEDSYQTQQTAAALRDTVFLAPLHEPLRCSAAANAAPTPSELYEGYMCYGRQEVAASSARVPAEWIGNSSTIPLLGQREGERYDSSSFQRFSTMLSCTSEGEVLQRLWISTVLRQQQLLLVSATMWMLLALPFALEVALHINTVTISVASQHSFLGLNSGAALLSCVQYSSAAAALLVVVLCRGDGGVWVLRRPRLCTTILVVGPLLSAAGFYTVYLGYLGVPLWLSVLGRALLGVGSTMVVLALMAHTMAEVGMAAGVILQLQLSFLMGPLVIILAVSGVPVLKVFLSVKVLFRIAVTIYAIGIVAAALLLCCLIPLPMLRAAVAQHLLFAGSFKVHHVLHVMSPPFAFRAATAGVMACLLVLLLFEAPILFSVSHQSALVNSDRVVLIACATVVVLWPLSYFPSLATVTSRWLPPLALVATLSASWYLFFQQGFLPPAFLAGGCGFVVAILLGTVMRSLANLGTSHYTQPHTALHCDTADALSDEEGIEVNLMTAGSNAAIAPGSPFSVMAVSSVFASATLVLLALSSAVLFTLLRDSDSSSAGIKTLVLGINAREHDALLNVLSSLLGLAAAAQVVEVLAEYNRWGTLC